jgi:hypothetical protein
MTEAADQIAANWAQVLAAISVAAGAVIAVVTIRSGRRISGQENTFRYLERQDLAEFRASIASARLVWGLRQVPWSRDRGVRLSPVHPTS